jgi:hypothetical protein
MPEFEQTDSQPNPAHSYSPSKDAAKKPRTRRRSGGFKTEVASSGSGNMGEVNPADALKQEKLSGSARRDEPRAERPARQPRTERRDQDQAPRAQREPRAPRERAPRNDESPEPRATRQERAPREPREERVTNPQPSAATLDAIKRVEAQIAERRAERDARRKEREKNRPTQTQRKSESRSKAPQPKGKNKPVRKLGLFATILNFFGKFIGIEIEEKPSKRDGGRKTQSNSGPNRRDGSRGGRSRQGGSRDGQNRGGSRSGQNRRSGSRGGQGRRSGNQKPHTAKSLSNES